MTFASVLKWRLQSVAKKSDYHRILKWDEGKHPRVPGGSGKESGQFTSGSGTGTVQESLVVPTPTPPPVFPKAQAPVDVLRARGGSQTRRDVAAEVAAVNVERAAYAKALAQGGRAYSKAPGMEPDRGEAEISDLMAAPTGTGFGNVPRLTGDPEMVQRLTPAPPTSDEALVSGQVIETKKKFGEGINGAYLVELEGGTLGVYKARSGEVFRGSFSNTDIPRFITNEGFALGEREAMASEVSVGLGFQELVPKTLFREGLDVDIEIPSDDDENEGGGYDEDYVRELYDEYKKKNDEVAMDLVGQEMYDLYGKEQETHLADINKRADEAAEVWNDLVEKEFPEEPDLEAQQEHPVLPMGSQEPFERRDPEVLDPLELMDEAKIDVAHTMSDAERENLRAVMRKHLQDGASALGDVDEDAARQHLNYDDFIEAHADTEGRLYQEKVQSFDAWRHAHGYDSGSGGGGRTRAFAPPGTGSLQRYVPGSTWGSPSLEDKTKMAVLDYVLGTMDRHGGNILYAANVPSAIDNGYTMPGPDTPDGFTFSSAPVKSWLSTDGSRRLSDGARKPIQEALETTDWAALADRHPNMSAKERAAFLGRIANVKKALERPRGLWELWDRQKMYG